MDYKYECLVSHLSSKETYSGCYYYEIQFRPISFIKNSTKALCAVIQDIIDAFLTLKLLISNGELLKSFVLWFKCSYICSNSTHSASHKNSKWVFFFLGQSQTYNTSPLLLCKARLGDLFFFSKPYSLITNTMN